MQASYSVKTHQINDEITIQDNFDSNGQRISFKIIEQNSPKHKNIFIVEYKNGIADSAKEYRTFPCGNELKTNTYDANPTSIIRYRNSLLKLPDIYGSELPLENQNSTLENFIKDTESREKLYQTAQEVLQDYSKTKVIFVYGKPGCGKTHMQAALAKEFLKRDQSVYFFGQGSASCPDSIPKNPDCKLLLLDDLTLPDQESYFTISEPTKTHPEEQLNLHCNLRTFIAWFEYAKKHKKILWISSNQTNLANLLDANNIQNDINTVSKSKKNCNVTELEELKKKVNDFKSYFFPIELKGQDGVKLRTGLADLLKTEKKTIKQIFDTAGTPPGVLIIDDIKKIQSQLPGEKIQHINPNQEVGARSSYKNIIILDKYDERKAALFMRDAWEKGYLLVLITNKNKEAIKKEMLEAPESAHEMHKGKGPGNGSRIDSMLVTYDEINNNNIVGIAQHQMEQPKPNNSHVLKEIKLDDGVPPTCKEDKKIIKLPDSTDVKKTKSSLSKKQIIIPAILGITLSAITGSALLLAGLSIAIILLGALSALAVGFVAGRFFCNKNNNNKIQRQEFTL